MNISRLLYLRTELRELGRPCDATAEGKDAVHYNAVQYSGLCGKRGGKSLTNEPPGNWVTRSKYTCLTIGDHQHTLPRLTVDVIA